MVQNWKIFASKFVVGSCPHPKGNQLEFVERYVHFDETVMVRGLEGTLSVVCEYAKSSFGGRVVEALHAIPRDLRSEVYLATLASGADLAGVDLGGEAEGVERFRDVLRRRRDIHEHECLGVSAQRVLKKIGQFGVAERNVLVLVGQGRNDIAQARQGFVDVFRLGESVALCSRGGQAL